MANMGIVNNFNNEVLDIWVQFHNNDFFLTNLYPELYPHPPQDPILFIGFNPSTPQNQNEFLFNGDINQNIVQEVIDFDIAARHNHPYFTISNAWAETLNIEPYYLDLFQSRITGQAEFNNLFTIAGTGIEDLELTHIHPFLQAQINLIQPFITQINPRIVVVINATASKLFYLTNQQNLNLDEQPCCYWLNETIPVLFSGMLSGARALDVFSRQRLYCSITNILENNL